MIVIPEALPNMLNFILNFRVFQGLPACSCTCANVRFCQVLGVRRFWNVAFMLFCNVAFVCFGKCLFPEYSAPKNTNKYKVLQGFGVRYFFIAFVWFFNSFQQFKLYNFQ